MEQWPNDVQAAVDFIMLLDCDDLPTSPFSMEDHRVVTDRTQFLRSLQADIRRGVDGPRSRSGSLQGDVVLLRNLLITSSN